MNEQPVSAFLQKRAFDDLNKRSRGGIIIYVLLWLAVGITVLIPNLYYVIFYVNLVIITILGSLRLMLPKLSNDFQDRHFSFFRVSFSLLIIASGIHWGVITAYILNDPNLQSLHWPMLLCAAALGASGTLVMAVSNVVRIFYPLVIVVPIIVIELYQAMDLSYLIAMLGAVFYVYIVVVSKMLHKDYWLAISTAERLGHRASELELISTTDPLTQLKNRLYFDEFYKNEWRRSHRQGQPIAILLIDIDNFKLVNDTYGHLFGDQCLQQVASSLQRVIQRSSDLLVRFGGEEFIVVLSNTTIPAAQLVAAKMLAAIRNVSMDHQGAKVPLTVSIGISSTIPSANDGADDLLECADQALYEAKAAGKDCCCVKAFAQKEPSLEVSIA